MTFIIILFKNFIIHFYNKIYFRFNLDLLKSGVERTNAIYGGKDLKVTRVVFPNGSIDPWHALGITADLSPDATAIFINGNLGPISGNGLF